MATISTTISATSGSSTAQCTLTATYSVSSTSPTATTVTSTTLAVGAIRVSGGTSQTQASARSSLVMSMVVAIVELTFGGNRVARTTGISESTTVTFSGTNSVAKGHSATTSPLKLNALGKTGTVNISVPVRTSFAVTFDANSGEGAPSNQTKWYDEPLTITSEVPTKTDYTCDGWATSTAIAGAGTVEYAPLSTYTANAGLDLYAVWERNYQKPTIDSLHVDRCQQNGTKDDDGTYALVTFTWGVFRTNDPLYYGGSDTAYSDNAVDSCTIQVGTQTATPTLTGASGTASVIVGNGTYDTDTSYAVSVSITDTQEVKSDNTTTIEGLLSMSLFPMDINEDATAIGFFRPAPDTEEGAFFAKKVDAPTYSVNGTAVADFIVDQGTDGIWTYRKWNSGIAECWGIYSKASVPANSVDNDNYITFPFTFTATPTITVGLMAGGADTYRGHLESGSTNNTQIRLTLINRYTSAVPMKMNIHALGKWK